jgi:tetratricopeptide (TPR) repeat protein
VVSRLDAQPPGTTFSIETPRGSVTAKGTTFAVEVSPTQNVSVRVHEGTVSIRLADGTERALAAPQTALLRDRLEELPPSPTDTQRDQALISMSSLWSDGASCALELYVTPDSARVTLDGIELGETPISALVTRGSRALRAESPGFVSVTEQLALVGAEHVVKHVVLLPQAVEAPTPSASAGLEVVTERSASDLLARARSLRSAGRYAEAAAAYRRLCAAYPRSAEARAALVSVGELQLSQLGDASEALRSFDAYLRGGGALDQEARYGKIRALGKLGLSDEEHAEVERFVRDYPRSVQAATLRSRLAAP